jgi:hypothetical protein
MGITHLETHRGKTKKLRTSATVVTSPTPETGDVFVDSTPGSEAIGVYKVNGWVYLSLRT